VSSSAPITRPMKSSDVREIVAIHIASFSGFFLTFLGERFLLVLYDRMLSLPGSIAFVAEDDENISGFVIGALSQVSLYRSLLWDHWPAFTWAALGPVLRRPSTAPRLLRALRRPAEVGNAAADCLLASIAVRPQAAGRGIGSSLVVAFLDAASRMGATAVSLTTDRDGNDRVNRFYRNLGFTLARSYCTAEGRWMNEYLISLPSASTEEVTATKAVILA
jgi:ribosomal protein S18 acetylase RimI-like enzyme